MKLEGSDPPRIAQAEDSELGRLVRSWRTRRPSPTASARMAQRLTAAGAFGPASSAASNAPGLVGRFGTAKLGVLAVVGLGLGLGLMTFAWHARNDEPAARPSVGTASQVVAEESPSPSLPPPPPSSAGAELPSVPVEALPSSATPAIVAAAPARTATSRAPSELRSHASPEVELAFIKRAQDALSSDPARALAIAEEHARTFPAGELVQEREVVTVEALARLGRNAEAKTRANALVRRFPRTPYVTRLERALGEPLSPPSPSPTAR